jgi:hypothetical protein
VGVAAGGGSGTGAGGVLLSSAIIVTIAQQYTAGAFSELKTDNARRRVPLPPEVLKDLKLWKLRCPYSKEAPSEGSDTVPTDAQVIELNGGPCRDRTYDQEIKSLLLYQLS